MPAFTMLFLQRVRAVVRALIMLLDGDRVYALIMRVLRHFGVEHRDLDRFLRLVEDILLRLLIINLLRSLGMA